MHRPVCIATVLPRFDQWPTACRQGCEEMRKTQKETIEYDAKFLSDWNLFCDSKGYVRRQASHACRIAFMKSLSSEQREQMMALAMVHILRSRDSRGKGSG